MNLLHQHQSSNQSSFLRCLQGSRADQVLLLILLLLIFGLWLGVQEHLNQGPPTVFIYHEQQLLAQYPVPQDEHIIRVAAVGALGTSDIELSKQGIRFISSPCTTQYCTLAGHKSHVGSVLACVPNHIMVVVRGFLEKDTQKVVYDAIAE
ncbi:MAG: NusG domain II-containing protein [Mariprofundaceae bacterium]|nr:NusG domain II-containing protein [Mariprofundaceae bacterium]